ncbi:MAG: hypothetical protein ISN29_02560 [Gammaproteobacteria bacterium AqS3]|nr:hypothetical protein [Gammaproteobacteria bacterium AqS3]
MNKQDRQDIEDWHRQLKKIKYELWSEIRVRVTGHIDREVITDLLAACLNRYNKILFKYEKAVDDKR